MQLLFFLVSIVRRQTPRSLSLPLLLFGLCFCNLFIEPNCVFPSLSISVCSILHHLDRPESLVFEAAAGLTSLGFRVCDSTRAKSNTLLRVFRLRNIFFLKTTHIARRYKNPVNASCKIRKDFCLLFTFHRHSLLLSLLYPSIRCILALRGFPLPLSFSLI